MSLLSILIPSIPSRKGKLDSLIDGLHDQIRFICKNIPEFGSVDIIVDDTKPFLEGGLSIGQKRNSLLSKAEGKYVCFLDDDENVSGNYIETILRLCSFDKDIVTFRTFFKNDGYWTVLNMDLNTLINEETAPGRVIQRTPWHICPMRREIAQSVSFSNLNHNEDWDWINICLRKVKTQAHTDFILTQYNHSSELSEADKIIRAGHA